MRAPTEVDAKALHRALHLRLSLADRGACSFDVSSLTSERDVGRLTERALAMGESFESVAVTLLENASPWSLRGLSLVAAGSRGSAQPSGIVVVSTLPADDGWDEIVVPPVERESVRAFLSERVTGDREESIEELLDTLDGSLRDVESALKDAFDRGVLITTSSGWDLTPHATFRPRSEGAVRTDDAEELAILETLTLAETPISLAALGELLERPATRC